MKPLNLRTRAPRPGRAQLAGVVFLPRTIDKARATLAGGDPGEYRLPGFSEDMLDDFGITLADFIEVVRAAADEEAVGEFVSRQAKPGSIAAWNAYITARRLFDGDRAKQIAVFPFLTERTDLSLALDVLDEDDRRLFASGS